MPKPLATISGLDDFGLNLRRLTAMDSQLIKVRAYYRYFDVSRLFPLTPAERKEKLTRWFQANHKAALKRWPGEPPTVIGNGEEPRGLEGKVAARAVTALRRIPQIEHIFVAAIPGLKRKHRSATEVWYAVQARFAVQREGQTKGRQLLEDRILLVKAQNAVQAEKRLQPEFNAYGKPYLNSEGFLVRWVYECTLHVQEVLESEISPRGTEVFSTFHSRHLKPDKQANPTAKRRPTTTAR